MSIRNSMILEYVKLVYFRFLHAQLNLREYPKQDAMVQKTNSALSSTSRTDAHIATSN
jgi:hypothetical protein